MGKIDELNQQVNFLEEKIAELSKVRDGLENEIAQTRKDAQGKLAIELALKSEQLDAEYEKRSLTLDDKQKYLDDYMIRLDKQSSEQNVKGKELETKETYLNSSVDDFNRQKELALKEFEGYKRTLDAQVISIQTSENGLKLNAMAQANERLNLDTKSLNIETAQINLAKEKEVVIALISDNQGILEEIEHEKKLTIEERNSIKELLDQIQAEKKTIVELSAYKDDLAKLEIEKTEFDAKRTEIVRVAAALTKRENDILEREKATTEKERYLEIKERDLKRDLDKKIEILNKLRQGVPIA